MVIAGTLLIPSPNRDAATTDCADGSIKVAIPYITITHNTDGSKTIKEHPSKTAAHEYGRKVREAGITIFAYSVDDAITMRLLAQTR